MMSSSTRAFAHSKANSRHTPAPRPVTRRPSRSVFEVDRLKFFSTSSLTDVWQVAVLPFIMLNPARADGAPQIAAINFPAFSYSLRIVPTRLF